MKKKYGLFGTILSISILLTLTILGPNAAAATDIRGSHLLSEVQAPLGTTNPVARGLGDIGWTFNGNPVTVWVDWVINNEMTGPSHHGFYLRVTNLDLTPQIETDEDELWIGITSGPVYETGTLDTDVNGRVGDRIEIFIYVNVTNGGNFDWDDDTSIITLEP